MTDSPEIARLIDEGLSAYGQGDLDAALGAWERALAIDPANPQVTSYVAYVRQHYDLLSNGGGDNAYGGPFAIADEEPYQIEILPGDALAGPPPISLEPPDAAWYIEDELAPRRSRTSSKSVPPGVTIELDADEPPAVSFDDETREYEGGTGARRPPPTGGPPPLHAATDRADTLAGPPAVAPADAPADAPEEAIELELQIDDPGFGPLDEDLSMPSFEGSQAGFTTESTDVKKRDTGFVHPARLPDVQITMRTPGAAPPPAPPAPSATPPQAFELPYDTAGAELIDSLPSPTPSPLTARTRELPLPTRGPARPSKPPVDTRDFTAGQDTAKLPGARSAPAARPPPGNYELLNAPTRDLGLREAASSTPMTPPPDDAPTLMRPSLDESTLSVTQRYVPSLDPIEARGVEILEVVDAGAPLSESADDRTRRRITALFERATAWSKARELERAVIAIDLALSEDPSSALAQKLIHRHRDVMMAVFQLFLGDLERQPVLARPLHELAGAAISPRAAFLLSRIDGSLSIEEILDVSGMPRLEAYRYLCQLFLRDILR